MIPIFLNRRVFNIPWKFAARADENFPGEGGCGSPKLPPTKLPRGVSDRIFQVTISGRVFGVVRISACEHNWAADVSQKAKVRPKRTQPQSRCFQMFSRRRSIPPVGIKGRQDRKLVSKLRLGDVWLCEAIKSLRRTVDCKWTVVQTIGRPEIGWFTRKDEKSQPEVTKRKCYPPVR